MPIFEYTCRTCGQRFETLVMGGRIPVCPHCSSEDLQKLHSAFGTRASGTAVRRPAASRFT